MKSSASGLRLEERGGIGTCALLDLTLEAHAGFEDVEDEDTESEDIDTGIGEDTATGDKEVKVTFCEEGIEDIGIPDIVLFLLEGSGGKSEV